MNDAAKIILVPIDLGEGSSPAVKLALELAGPLGAEVVLMHVFTLPNYAYAGVNIVLPPESIEEISSRAQQALEEYAMRHGGLRSLLREGDPGEEIVRAIEDVRPYMVVMGTHGRRGVKRMLLGSVAEKVVRRSPVPVVVAKRHDDHASKGEGEDRRPPDCVRALDLACP